MQTGAGIFSTEEQFADLIGPDNKRLVEIWNSLPDVNCGRHPKEAAGASLRMKLTLRTTLSVSQPNPLVSSTTSASDRSTPSRKPQAAATAKVGSRWQRVGRRFSGS